MEEARPYLAIDLKSFYASVECVDRGLDPLTANLVVADPSRTDKTICLAVSPALKARGISGRPRLFEVVQKVREVNARRLQAAIKAGKALRDAKGNFCLAASSFDDRALQDDCSLAVGYIVAPPRMARYLDVSAQIYGLYLKYIAPQDIHAYSVDEVFMDVAPYLNTYGMNARALAMTMIREVLYATGITATAGLGSNLYLAKIAMDIVAKHMQPDQDGVRLAELDEMTYRRMLWDHKPLTDFWRIGPGTARRLEKHNVTTMGELARLSTYDQPWLYKTFGVDAQLLIDHAWGIEPCTMAYIKRYKPTSSSISEGQVLTCPYPYDKARLVVREMAENLVMQLTAGEQVTDSLTLDLLYDRENVDKGGYQGAVCVDYYNRTLPKPAHGSVRLQPPTNLGSRILSAAEGLFEKITNPSLSIRKIAICAAHLTPEEENRQMDMFSDPARQSRERSLQRAMVEIKGKFGKNAVLRGASYLEGATMRERNSQIGGHKA